MKISWSLLVILLSVLSNAAFGYGLGVSTHPIEEKKKLVQAEFVGLAGRGHGMGVQARFVQKIQPSLIVDAGVATDKNGLVGDVADEVREMPDITMTPNKGGVGPLTVCALFDNVIRAARQAAFDS